MLLLPPAGGPCRRSRAEEEELQRRPVHRQHVLARLPGRTPLCSICAVLQELPGEPGRVVELAAVHTASAPVWQLVAQLIVSCEPEGHACALELPQRHRHEVKDADKGRRRSRGHDDAAQGVDAAHGIGGWVVGGVMGAREVGAREWLGLGPCNEGLGDWADLAPAERVRWMCCACHGIPAGHAEDPAAAQLS